MHLTPLMRATKIQSWPAQPLSTDSITANGVLFSGPCLFRGYCIGNGNAGAITVEVYDGLDTKGSPLAFINLGIAASDKLWIGSPGVSVEEGIYITASGFPIKGAFWYTPINDHELERLEHMDAAMKGVPGHGTRG